MRLVIFTICLLTEVLAYAESIRDNETIESNDSQENFLMAFPEIEADIKKFYANVVFETMHDTGYCIADICTAEFLHKLSSANDYNGQGYATWLLRSGEQDGDDTPCRIEAVTAGDNRTITVDYSDMGHDGSTTLTMVLDGGKWKIDNCTVPHGYDPL